MKFWKNTYKDKPDESLMKSIAQGDTHAFDTLYQRYKDRLYYYFYRMLGNSEVQAEDFLQELFYKIIDKPQLFDPSRKFSTWIFSIANNMCKNEYRRLEVRETHASSLLVEEATHPAAIESHQSTLAEIIYKEIQLLNQEHQSCFILFYREEFPVDTIAEILSISNGTVKSRLFYARKKIRQILEKNYPELVKEVCYEL